MHKRQNAEIITRRGYYIIPPARCAPSSSSFESAACSIITIARLSRHGFSCARCIRLFLRSPFSLSRNWRVAAGTGYAGRWFWVSSFASDAVSCARCVRRAVTKHRNSYERGTSKKQVALQFRPSVLFMDWKRQETRVRRLKYQRIRLRTTRPFIFLLETNCDDT